MTLTDAGTVFRFFAAAVGVFLVARALYPFYIERSRQRGADREAASIDEYIESLERQHNGARK